MSVKVNRLTVTICEDGERTEIKAYDGTKQVAILDTNVPSFNTAKRTNASMRKTAYIEYIRNTMVNLIKNDGVDGYHWEDRKVVGTLKRPVLDNLVLDKLQKMLLEVTLFTSIQFGASEISDVKLFKNGGIESCIHKQTVTLGTSDGSTFVVHALTEVRSGQLCRPHAIRYKNREHQFNITTFRQIATNKI